ncbi:MAG TPA: hypothetical protein VHL58_00240 [Thermoanaerobaculia bacterium]|nr:hypothetical protein [Thermoanaerobaculia bacterium]
MKHYSEVDLLEHYYLPSSDTAVSEHVAGCPDCLGRFKRLQLKLQAGRKESCSSIERKPATFWKRQQIAIKRKIDAVQPQRRMDVPRLSAAAALVVLLAGGVWMQERSATSSVKTASVKPAVVRSVTTSATSETLGETRSEDPWASDELKDFHSVVQWESWEDPSTGSRKGTS